MGKKDDMEARALDSIVGSCESFTIECSDGSPKTLYIYPLQLGRLAMISRRLLDLDLTLDGDCSDAVQKMWRICSEKPQEVAEIIAIATLRTKEDVEKNLRGRTEELMWSPTMDARAYTNILYIIVFMSCYKDFMKAIRSVRTLRVRISPETDAGRIAHTEEEASGER